MTVLHSSPLTGIRQFIALAGKQAMIKSALSVLELGVQAKLECPAASIKEETISQVRDLVQVGKVDDARALLVRAGWNEPTLTTFLNSMQKPIFSCTVTHVIHHPDGDGDMRSFSILQSEDGLWMLEGDKDHVQVKSSDAGEISQRIVEMVG
jgi:hypothetical protein